MAITNIDNIKDRVYELEGLLELSRLREDKLADLLPLIKRHAAEIHQLLNDVELSSKAGESPAKEIENPEDDTESPANESEALVYEVETSAEAAGKAVEEVDNIEVLNIEVAPEVSVTQDFKTYRRESQIDKPAFCINDRFRFRRGLFNNSDADFTSAMDLVATMDSYEEAEEYFLGDLGWDADNQDVADFMEIIRIYFEHH